MTLPLQVSTGPMTDALRALLVRDAAGLIIGLLLVAAGLMALTLFASRREAKDLALLAYAGFSGLYGARLLVTQPTTGVVLDLAPETMRTISAYITYVIPVCAFAFARQMLGPGWKSTFRIGTWIAVAFAVVASSLDGPLRARGMLMAINNYLVIGFMISTFYHLFLRPPSNAPGLLALRLGTVILGVFALGENLAGLGVPVWPRDREWMGFLVFSGCLVYAVAQRVTSNERKLMAVEAELEAARRIQSSILPEGTPNLPGLDVAVRYVPATSVAGDFFDFHALDGTSAGILVADVSGHGVPAALIASMVKVAFSSQADIAEDPAAVLGRMNRILFAQGSGTFVTAAYVFLDLPRRQVRCAVAGHPPPLVWRKRENGVQILREGGLVLGTFRDTAYSNSDLTLEPGDRLVLYTDGITEEENPEGELFGEDRLVQFVAGHSSMPAGALVDGVLGTLAAWRGRAARERRRDDVTLIVADFHG